METGPNYALFVDYEDVSVGVDKTVNAGGEPPRDVGGLVVRLLGRLMDMLGSKDHGFMAFLLGRGYGAWSGITNVPTELALLSIKPVYVLARTGKSSADLELSLDAQETMLRRDDIQSFVIVGGDRDYIPIVRRIREQGKGVTVVALNAAMSGDLKKIIGSRFIPLDPVIDSIVKEDETAAEKSKEALTQKAKGRPASPLWGKRTSAVTDENVDKTLDLVVKSTAGLEPMETPLVVFYKDYMNDAFVTLNNEERKALIEGLRQTGAIDLEIRKGPSAAFSSFGGEFIALVVNENHPFVKKKLKALDNASERPTPS